MGDILSSKVFNGKIVFKILLNPEEVMALKNSMKNIYFFSGELCNQKSLLIEKGFIGVTKYFNIPPNLRVRKRKSFGSISYQKLETESKIFFIYIVNKSKVL